MLTYGYRDTTLGFYYDDWNEAEGVKDLRAWLSRDVPNLVILADAKDWRQLEKKEPGLANRFALIFKWNRSPLTKDRLVLRPKKYLHSHAGAAKAGASAEPTIVGGSATAPAGPW